MPKLCSPLRILKKKQNKEWNHKARLFLLFTGNAWQYSLLFWLSVENPCMNEWHSSLSYEAVLTCQFQMSTIISSGLSPKAYPGEDNFKLQKTQVNNTHFFSSEVQLNSSVVLKISHDTLVWPINCTCSLFLSLLFWGGTGPGGGKLVPLQ